MVNESTYRLTSAWLLSVTVRSLFFPAPQLRQTCNRLTWLKNKLKPKEVRDIFTPFASPVLYLLNYGYDFLLLGLTKKHLAFTFFFTFGLLFYKWI